MAEDADIASNAIDAARIKAVSAAVGPLRLGELILILAGRVESLAAAAEMFPEAAEDCLPALHQTRGSAASLGFGLLADGLARMEAQLRQTLLRAQAGERDLAAAWGEVLEASRALPRLWKDALRAKEDILLGDNGKRTEGARPMDTDGHG
jgi:hypothetical protein